MAKYDAVIGLEAHIQINTESKMFCSCPNRYGEAPNTLICPVCMGYPGVLPTPNGTALRKTVIAGLLCGCEIARYSKFDRKSYFYPDMPKNYQISQYDLPLCRSGAVHIRGKGFSGAELPDKKIGITRIHLEEDVAKLTHFRGSSGVDYNRAGVPLMETVSEPEIHSPDEAYAYLIALKEIMQYGGISDCDMEKGQMRCDVNISLKPAGAEKFGTKIEIKNLNSFRAVHRALEYEIRRQGQLLEEGAALVQETRGWNDDKGESYLMRSKENAHDYRYFPEPDLMPMTFTDRDVAAIRATLPELPETKRRRLVETYNLTPYDAQVLTLDRTVSEFFEAGVKLVKTPKLLANWIISELLRETAERGTAIPDCGIAPEQLAELVNLIESNTISGKIAKTVFTEMFTSGKKPADIVKEKGLIQVTDASEIDIFVEQAITQNPAQVQQYREGKTQVLQYLVGQVMKLSRGKANPPLAIALLRKKLS